MCALTLHGMDRWFPFTVCFERYFPATRNASLTAASCAGCVRTVPRTSLAPGPPIFVSEYTGPLRRKRVLGSWLKPAKLQRPASCFRWTFGVCTFARVRTCNGCWTFWFVFAGIPGWRCQQNNFVRDIEPGSGFEDSTSVCLYHDDVAGAKYHVPAIHNHREQGACSLPRWPASLWSQLLV